MKRLMLVSALFASLAMAPLTAFSQKPHPWSPQKTGQIEIQVSYCGGNTGLLVQIPGINQQVVLGPSGKGVFYFVVPGTYTLAIEIKGHQPYEIQNVVVQDNAITQVMEEFCRDIDGDGYDEDVDCNDNNSDYNPGADEVCDGFDNNCDGVTDEGCALCTDADTDGFYAQAGCGTQVDCDDSVPTINPVAPETCDGVDNNCDGQVDEVFDTDTDPNNCGACGEVCSLDNAIADCIDGVCEFSECLPNFASCDGDEENGCEIDLGTDSNNCGACDYVCPSGFCDAGTCEPLLSNGDACNSPDECQSGNCVDGYCCDTSCSGACDSCDLPGSVGTCTVNPPGSLGDPTCFPYLCNGATAFCPATCSGNSDCIGGYNCDAGTCGPLLNNGDACISPDECQSGNCVDGFCCNTICGSACDSCDVAGSEGTCTVNQAGDPGDPSCAHYVCDGYAPVCPTSCSDDSDCASGNFCFTGHCVGP